MVFCMLRSSNCILSLSELPEESHILQLIVIKGIFVEHLQPETYMIERDEIS